MFSNTRSTPLMSVVSLTVTSVMMSVGRRKVIETDDESMLLFTSVINAPELSCSEVTLVQFGTCKSIQLYVHTVNFVMA